MGLFLDQYSFVFGGLDQFTADEKKEIGKFAADMMVANISRDSDKCAELIDDWSKTAEQAAEEATRYADGILLIEAVIDELEKRAASIFSGNKPGGLLTGIKALYEQKLGPKADPAQRALSLMLLTGMGIGLSPTIAAAIKTVGDKFKHATSLNTVLAYFPQLLDTQDISEIERQFETIKKFAPDVATDPYLIGQLLLNVQSSGGGAVLPGVLVQQALHLQKAINERDPMRSVKSDPGGSILNATNTLARMSMGGV